MVAASCSTHTLTYMPTSSAAWLLLPVQVGCCQGVQASPALCQPVMAALAVKRVLNTIATLLQCSTAKVHLTFEGPHHPCCGPHQGWYQPLYVVRGSGVVHSGP